MLLKRWWWVILLAAVAGPVIGLFVAAVMTYMMPKHYESTAMVQVVEDPRVAALPSLPTECKVIKTQKTLELVSEALELPTRWGMDRDQVLASLMTMIDVRNIPGTDLIVIKVRHTNAEDARDVAMEAAKAYRARRTEIVGEHLGAGEIPRESVILHEQPTLALRPASPNVPLNLAVGAGGGLVCGLLLAFPAMGALNRIFRRP